MTGEQKMDDKKTGLTELASWKALKDNHAKIKDTHMRELFAADPNRGSSMVIDAEGVYFDYSKHRVNDETVKLLVKLAEE